jgi:GT2 family glycosyltransferase
MSKIGLVTVLYNSDSVLEGFFRSLSSQTFKDYHLYLVDNAPSFNTNNLIMDLTKRYPISSYTHIKNEKNLGVAEGNNQGINLSVNLGCTHTLLLNNDIEFSQDFLLHDMIKYSLDFKEYLIIPKILYYETCKVWMAGGDLRKSRGTVRHFGDGDTDGIKYSKSGYFAYAPTCFMLIDNIVFQQIGIMDEKYFVYYDDTDFILRATNADFRVFLMPSLIVLHKVSSSTGGSESLFSIYYSNRNRIYFLRKNFKGLGFLIPIFYTLATRFLRYIAYNKSRKMELIRAVKDGFAM